MLRSLDGMVDVGCRFQYIEPKIKFGYKYLVEALNAAIDKEEENSGKEYVTSERPQYEVKELDFDELMSQFQNIIANIPGSSDSSMVTPEGKRFNEYWVPRISEIITRYLGSGKKISQCNRNQVEQLSCIVDELKELLKKEN